jgi:uncharacterized membrane protein
VLLLAVTFVGVVVVPLGIETHIAQAQPEVRVIERAGQAMLHGQSPYRVYEVDGHLVHAVKGVPAFQSFFPYGPLMAPFGIFTAVAHREKGLPDARVVMSVFTILMMLLALWMLRAPPGGKIRVAQALTVLPTGSLFLATGGDDMPILALCLLTLVAIQRQRPWVTGVLIGIAAAMKLTAWPFLLVALAVSRDREGRRTWGAVLTAASCVLAATMTPYILTGPRAFVANVFAFPLGLAGVNSPAASPLPGHLLTNAFPPLGHVLLPAVFVVGSIFLVRYLRRHWPLSLPSALRVLATVMTVVICSATATRLGYLIYPIDFLLWAAVLTPQPVGSVDRVALVEVQSP